MFFDTHAHYDISEFDEDRDDLLNSMIKGGVMLIMNAGNSLENSKICLELADKYPFIYASVGTHAYGPDKITDETITELERLLAHPKAVAVGEIGLDYFHKLAPHDIQKQHLYEQLELARRIKKPVIIHSRDSFHDILEIIRNYKDLTGVFHCFSGCWETAKTILDMGWYLSFTGNITYKKSDHLLEVIKNMPSDRILIETDSPCLAPVPLRGQRNTSLTLPYIAKKIAVTRGITIEEVAITTMQNGMRFYSLE